jgi:hypothetical protein
MSVLKAHGLGLGFNEKTDASAKVSVDDVMKVIRIMSDLREKKV